MIAKFVERWEAGKAKLQEQYRSSFPEGYGAIVKDVVEILHDEDDYGRCPDPERIHCIDDGDYQGTLLFVIGATGYRPSTYWAVAISYGSCSGCDTFEAIRRNYDGPQSDETIADLMALALHIVQGLKCITDGELDELEALLDEDEKNVLLGDYPRCQPIAMVRKLIAVARASKAVADEQHIIGRDHVYVVTGCEVCDALLKALDALEEP